MKTKDVVLAGIAGTTAFTLFSYIVSKKMKKNFKEPELLGDMMKPAMPVDVKVASPASGWMAHYLVGTGFAASYAVMINKARTKPTLKNGVIYGALSGLVAVAWWHNALKQHPSPPRQPSKNYYGHLFLGHIIFGMFSFLSFGMLQQKRNQKTEIDSEISFRDPSYKLSRYATTGS